MDIAFIAGATGYSGKGAVAACCRAGIDTYAHVRPDSAQLARWQGRFEAMGAHVDTTAWELSALTERLQALKPTVVYGLLGTTKARGRKSGGQDTYESVDYGLTKMLIDAAVACGSAPRFVYMSSYGAGRMGMSGYLNARTRVEQHLEQSGLPHTIVRAGPIGGPDREEDRPAERVGMGLMVKVLRGLDAIAGSELEKKYGPVNAEEMGRALVHLRADTALRRIVAPHELRSDALQKGS